MRLERNHLGIREMKNRTKISCQQEAIVFLRNESAKAKKDVFKEFVNLCHGFTAEILRCS